MTHGFMIFFDFFKPDDYDYAPMEIPEGIDLQKEYLFRAVFGLQRFKEKIVILEHGLNDIDNGHNYLGEIEYDDSSVTKLLKTMGLLDELDLIYENALERTEIIQNKIDNGEYKAIFITENEGYAEVNTDLYELKDEMHLTTGTQASELNIYELKNEVEH